MLGRRRYPLWLYSPLIIGLFTLIPMFLMFDWKIVFSDLLAACFGCIIFPLIGLLPFIMLSAILYVAFKNARRCRLKYLYWCGLLSILAIVVPVNILTVLPTFTGGHQSSTQAFGFILVPMFGVPALAVGLGVGWLLSIPAARREGNSTPPPIAQPPAGQQPEAKNAETENPPHASEETKGKP